jgi:lipopolysaccharide transport system ATP-binding protein
MAEVVIQVEQLSKQYALGVVSTGTLAHDLNRWWAKLLHRTDPMMKVGFHSKVRGANGGHDSIWALKDVSFEVKQGEVLGIVGRNGAGKSTLLKILSRVTAPTAGECRVRGRIASLLEVGTGFHPELTGKENIFLNGAILGMTRREIRKKFDDIVSFAEIEQFVDTPVKRYSSGMYVRLAFAVAAHLDPEILLVDEVLAVGDAQFQQKCLGKMKDIGREGRTVLFVSHNMAAVNQLCSRAMLLRQGGIDRSGEVQPITNAYLSEGVSHEASVDLEQLQARRGTGALRFTAAQVRNRKGEACQHFSIGDDVAVAFRLINHQDKKRVKLAVQLRTSDGLPLSMMIDGDSGFEFEDFKRSEQFEVTLNDVRFYPGTYYVSLYATAPESIDVYDHVQDVLMFHIVDGGQLTARTLPRSYGLLFLTPAWTRL